LSESRMRENLTYGLMWRGVETRTSVPGATPRPYNPSVRPVTGLAKDASLAPVRPAGYAQR